MISLATFGLLTFFNGSAQSQTNQTLGQCISEVHKATNYTVYGEKAAQSCINTLRYQTPTERLGSCISGVQQSTNYTVYGEAASSICQSLLEQQRRYSSPTPNGNYPTILVVPQGQPVQSQPTQRRTQRQCINKTFNQVWNDIHCEFNNGMFEWRTIYLD